MRGNSINLMIGGEAGQGLATIGEILAKALVRHGYAINVTQSYHSRIRGGHNTFTIRMAADEVQGPEEAIDLLVALNQETVTLHSRELVSEGIIITDQAFAMPAAACAACVPVPFAELADKKTANVAALAILGALLGLDREIIAKTVDDYFGAKPEAAAKNRQALAQGFQWADRHPAHSRKLPPPKSSAPRLVLDGNQALALGALAAGLKFYAFYPMSPSTSIGIALADQMKRLPLVVEQAEDEIAAINMAIGASFAGAPSMVGTSGGGFALMVEGVSLAAMTETPIVIVIAQRPGPATGLPTRTAQADLELALAAGHGEFPRAVFAPGTVEDCFYLAGQALALAEAAQGPIFILTDQYIADCSRAVAPFELDNLPIVNPRADAGATAPYRRYSLTPSGISPRLLPGLSKNLVVADSDEHTEDGHLTEDLEVRKKMVEKRNKKFELLLREVVPPVFVGDENPERLLVTWGSSRGAVLEAAAMMREKGRRAAVLHFSQVWPLRFEHFLPLFESAGEVVMVEGNAFGQFARLLRRETGYAINRLVLRYDGLPITPEFIMRELGEG